MATFAELENDVRLIIDIPVDVITLLRQAENRFITETLCTEKVVTLNTAEFNEGELTHTYAIPDADMVDILRIEFNGYPLEKANKNPSYRFHDSEGKAETGTPGEYWQLDQSFRLLPKPGSHGIIRLWYVNMNVSTDGQSPIIPVTEQEYLPDRVIGKLFEKEGQEDRALYYLQKFDTHVEKTKFKYRKLRNTQKRITDKTGSSFDNVIRQAGITFTREGVDGWAPQ